MNSARNIVIVFLIVCFTSVGVHIYLDYQHKQNIIATKKLTQKILNMYQTEIEKSQNNGYLYIYDPPLTSQMELVDIFELLEHKDGIKKITFDGSPSHVFDKKIIEIIVTMPDIEILEIHRTRLSKGLFEPLNKSLGIHTLNMRKCFADPEAYDLAHAKNIKSLSILEPLEFDRDGMSTTMSLQAIINFLCQYKHLDYLVLDRVFFEWKDDLIFHLRSTKIDFCSCCYSCPTDILSPENAASNDETDQN
jgi:hypothetical protein